MGTRKVMVCVCGVCVVCLCGVCRLCGVYSVSVCVCVCARVPPRKRRGSTETGGNREQCCNTQQEPFPTLSKESYPATLSKQTRQTIKTLCNSSCPRRPPRRRRPAPPRHCHRRNPTAGEPARRPGWPRGHRTHRTPPATKGTSEPWDEVYEPEENFEQADQAAQPRRHRRNPTRTRLRRHSQDQGSRAQTGAPSKQA